MREPPAITATRFWAAGLILPGAIAALWALALFAAVYAGPTNWRAYNIAHEEQ